MTGWVRFSSRNRQVFLHGIKFRDRFRANLSSQQVSQSDFYQDFTETIECKQISQVVVSCKKTFANQWSTEQDQVDNCKNLSLNFSFLHRLFCLVLGVVLVVRLVVVVVVVVVEVVLVVVLGRVRSVFLNTVESRWRIEQTCKQLHTGEI